MIAQEKSISKSQPPEIFFDDLIIKLRSFVRRREIYDIDDADDIIMTTLYKVLKKFQGKEKTEDDWGALSTHIVKAEISNYWKHKKRESQFQVDLSDELHLGGSLRKPEAEFFSQERLNYWSKLINKLPFVDRVIILCTYFEGMDSEEICEYLSSLEFVKPITAKTVSNRKSLAKDQLKSWHQDLVKKGEAF